MKGINQEEHRLLQEQPLNLVPIDEHFIERRTVSGLIIPMPDGEKKLMVVTPISGMALGLWRRQLNAKIFTVQGDMVFNVDLDSYKEYENFEQGRGRL